MGYLVKLSIIEYNSFLIYIIINVNEIRDLNLIWQDSLYLMEFVKRFINLMNFYCYLVFKISFDFVFVL